MNLTSEYYNELYHYGVKGMKWGVRRYQNKDGSLTAVGRKRLSRDIKKKYKRDYDSAQPLKTSDSYKKLVKSSIDKCITDDDRARITSAKNKYKAIEKDKLAAENELFNIAEKHAINNIKARGEDIDSYSPRDREKVIEWDIWDSGWNKAVKDRPDLQKTIDKADSLYDDYINESRRATDKILGKYGDQKLVNIGGYKQSINDSVSYIMRDMAEKDWKN